MTEFENKVSVFVACIDNAYKDKDNRKDFEKLSIQNDRTEDFSAMLYAMYVIYSRCDNCEENDIIGFTYLLNRIVFQRMLKMQKERVYARREDT